MADFFPGCNECIYIPGIRSASRSIIMGLFPPANADATLQYDNETSKVIWKIKGDYNYDWNELAPYSPTRFAFDFDDKWLAKEVKGRTAVAYQLVCAWWARAKVLIARENQAGAIPVVLWAGKIVEDAMGWLVEMGLIPGAGGVSYNTPYMQVRFNPCFISLEGCVHPSSALMGGSRAILKATYQCFAALCVQPHRNAALLYAAVDADVMNDALVHVDAYDMVGLPHDNGWLSNNFRHLREVDWSDQNVLTSFLRLRDVCGDGNFLRLAEYSIGAHVEEPAFVDNVCTLLSVYNTERAMCMLCTDSVVANLGTRLDGGAGPTGRDIRRGARAATGRV